MILFLFHNYKLIIMIFLIINCVQAPGGPKKALEMMGLTQLRELDPFKDFLFESLFHFGLPFASSNFSFFRQYSVLY